MNTLKGIAAVLAGLIFIVVSHSATDFVLESLGIFTPRNQGFHTTWMVLTATAYRSIFAIGGGYISAALAPNKPMRYAVVLGMIGLAVGAIAAIVTIPMGIAPTWYPIALAILALPCTWLGGKLRTR